MVDLPRRYDTVPDSLVLNNTVQIVYDSNNTPGAMVEYDEITTLNDTVFVPILEKPMAPADIEYRLDVYFDVRAFPSWVFATE
jgi:iron transport multicopper oxidase